MNTMQKVTAETIIGGCQNGYAPEAVDQKFIQTDASKWTAVPNQGITSRDAATVFHEGYETLRDMVRRKAGLCPAQVSEGNRFAASIKKSIVETVLDWMGEYFSRATCSATSL